MKYARPISVFDDYSIRKVTTMEESIKITHLMIDIWEMSELEAVPTFEMRAVADFGTVLMAYPNSEPETPIGYIYAFPNFDSVHYKNYSHMMGIRKDWQSRGVGYQLKLAHRMIALSSSPKIYSIEWTVDPLLPNNAALNFGKLGCICRTYKVDYYGDPADIGIYQGVPTDRFLVEWILESGNVTSKLSKVSSSSISPTEEILQKYLVINSIVENRYFSNKCKVDSQSPFLVEVPWNYQEIRTNELEKAIEWRLKFREICLKYFSKDWVICDYIRTVDQAGERHNYYLFSPYKLVQEEIK